MYDFDGVTKRVKMSEDGEILLVQDKGAGSYKTAQEYIWKYANKNEEQ